MRVVHERCAGLDLHNKTVKGFCYHARWRGVSAEMGGEPVTDSPTSPDYSFWLPSRSRRPSSSPVRTRFRLPPAAHSQTAATIMAAAITTHTHIAGVVVTVRACKSCNNPITPACNVSGNQVQDTPD